MMNLQLPPHYCKTDVMRSVLVHADCFDVFPYIADESVQLILCDLPYGTTACKWDSVLPFDKLWEQYERIVKPNGAIVLTASQPFTSALVMSNTKLFRYEFIWDKIKGSGFLNANKMPIIRHETILVFYKKLPTYNKQMKPRNPNSHSLGRVENYTKKEAKNTDGVYGMQGIEFKRRNVINDYSLKNPDSIIEISVGNNRGKYKRLHPTQKPTELFEYLIKTYTNEGDLVLDNTAGSGTTAIACLNTKRQFIVMEKEQKYYDIILKRVADFNKNFEPQTLFGNEI